MLFVERYFSQVFADRRKRRVAEPAGVFLPPGILASNITVGLPVTASAKTLELDAGGRDGSLMGRRKRVTQAYLSVLETDVSSLKVASLQKGRWEQARLDTVAKEKATQELVTGLLPPLNIDDSWSGQGRVHITHSGPKPCTIRALIPAFDAEP